MTYIEEKRKELESIDLQISGLKKDRAKVVGYITDATTKIQAACPHIITADNTVSYMEGGYDYVSETVIEKVCRVCDAVLERHKVYGTYA